MLHGVEITLSVYALVLSQSRRQHEALFVIERAIKLDPLDPIAPELNPGCCSWGANMRPLSALRVAP